MMYLLDTNIILEYLLEQERSGEVEQFFLEISANQLYLSEFSLYSLGIICGNRGKEEAFLVFVEDVILSSGLRILRLIPQDYSHLMQVQKKFHLDFDDAYQYCLAEKYNLEIVSFDSDFDKTDRKRKVPSKIIRS